MSPSIVKELNEPVPYLFESHFEFVKLLCQIVAPSLRASSDVTTIFTRSLFVVKHGLKFLDLLLQFLYSFGLLTIDSVSGVNLGFEFSEV